MKDPITGKRRQYRKTFTTQKAAKSWLAQQKVDVDNGTVVVRDPRTMGELLDFWLHNHIKHHVSSTTFYGYEINVRVHITPKLGAIPVQQLTPAHIQRFFSDKIEDGCGARTLQLSHLHISQALDLAVGNGWVARNVADSVKPPKWVSKEAECWSQDEAQKFLAVAPESAYGRPFWVLCLTKGLRRGELLGMRSEDIDLDKGTLQIRQTFGPLHGQVLPKPPKSAKSRRTVELKDGIVALLRAHKAAQLEKRLKMGPRWEDHDLVFPNTHGGPINPDNIDRDYDKLVKKAGVKRITIHGLRHTYATLALAAGEDPKVVSESLGHATVAITLHIYRHVRPTDRHELADRMERLFLGATPQQDELTG
jgi:integrase